MFKNLSATTKLFGGLIALVFVVMVVMIAIHGNQAPQPTAHYLNDNASADTKVEALKTLTADLLAVEDKNKALTQQVMQLKTQNQQTAEDLKRSMQTQLQQALQTIQQQNEKNQQALTRPFAQQNQAKKNALGAYSIHQEEDHTEPPSHFVWVSDLSKPSDLSSHHANSLGVLEVNLDDQNEKNKSNAKNKAKNNVKPRYTIPVNATLTGAVLMTPLIGRVPIDGQLPSPYRFKAVLSDNNLTANGYPMPGIQGAVVSGIASGDLLGRCARGDVQSITFIFKDGTISTTQVKGENQSLGYLSSQTGNPCISGSFHSNAALFLGAQMGLAGLEGYAHAISDSQYLNSTTSEGVTLKTLMGSANKAAIGQGGSAAAEAAQTWWNRRVQNSFDFIYVSNVNPNTRRPMKVVINITQHISINHNPNARRVNYETVFQNHHTELD